MHGLRNIAWTHRRNETHMRAKAGQFIRAAAFAALFFQSASAEDTTTREPPTATGETVEVVGQNLEPLVMVRLPRPKYPKDAKGVSGWNDEIPFLAYRFLPVDCR
jgi:hypothetical protein